jgi:hypothetical protein
MNEGRPKLISSEGSALEALIASWSSKIARRLLPAQRNGRDCWFSLFISRAARPCWFASLFCPKNRNGPSANMLPAFSSWRPGSTDVLSSLASRLPMYYLCSKPFTTSRLSLFFGICPVNALCVARCLPWPLISALPCFSQQHVILMSRGVILERRCLIALPHAEARLPITIRLFAGRSRRLPSILDALPSLEGPSTCNKFSRHGLSARCVAGAPFHLNALEYESDASP